MKLKMIKSKFIFSNLRNGLLIPLGSLVECLQDG